ncbi:MAG: MarR family transcriptional regulator [Woeseiaceae bacterium]|nr:MarR family transcriptional regulator [Woeseiaceae bacterium]
MARTKHDYMLAWATLVHVGTFLPSALSQYLHDELGISLAEQDLLKQLSVAGGRLKLVELSRRIFLSKAGVTKMIDRLETNGLVVRQRSKSDRRVIYAELGEAGREVLKESQQLLGAWVKANLSDHLSDKQLRDLLNALRSVLEGHGRWNDQLAHLRGEATG